MNPPYLLSAVFSRLTAIMLLLAVAMLSGCGGGVDVAEGVGSGGTGITMGTVNGFGSVIVDGQRIDDASATVEAESEPGTPNKSGQDEVAVKLGQRVVIDNDTNAKVATRVRIFPELIGMVDSVDLAQQRLVVAGQEVRIIGDGSTLWPTVLDGLDGLADVSVGQRLEVHGYTRRDPVTSAYYIAATRIERRLSSQSFVRVSGYVRAVDTSNATLQLGNLTVRYGSVVKWAPRDAVVAVGRKVVVWSSQPVAGGVLEAQAIAVVQRTFPNRALRVGGVVSGCPSAGACVAKFTVSGQTVDASAARFSGANAGALVDGVYVRVIGRTDATGLLKATEVIFRASNADDVTLIGSVTDYVSDQSFKVRSVPVAMDTSTVIDGACTVAAGRVVVVKGAVQGNKVLAKSVECVNTLEGVTLDLHGVLSNLNTAMQTLRVNGLLAAVPVSYAVATLDTGSAGTLLNGQYVLVHGQVSSGVVRATQITVGTAPSGSQFDTQGLVYGLQAAAFRINGLTINFNPQVVAGGASLENGQRVHVRFTSTMPGVYQALAITLL